MNGTPLTLGLVGALAAGAALSRRGSSAKVGRVTLGPTSGPSDEREADVLLDGEPIGVLISRKSIRFRPAKQVAFSHVEVTLWEPYDYEAVFSAEVYGDAATARRAALEAVRSYVSGASGSRARRVARRSVYHLTYASDLPSIARTGLVPQPGMQQRWDNEPGVYYVGTFGYEAGAPEGEEPAWLKLPAPQGLDASFFEGLNEGRTLDSFSPDQICVWVDRLGRPASRHGGSRWAPLLQVVAKRRGAR